MIKQFSLYKIEKNVRIFNSKKSLFPLIHLIVISLLKIVKFFWDSCVCQILYWSDKIWVAMVAGGGGQTARHMQENISVLCVRFA